MADPMRLPDTILPELRAKWIRNMAAREVVQGAAQVMQRMEREYQDTLSIALRLIGADPSVNQKVNLETGEISEVTAADVVQGQNQVGAVPWVAPTSDSQN